MAKKVFRKPTVIDRPINDIKNRIIGKKVIDVGCCGGVDKANCRYYKQFKECASNIVGVDVNKKFIKDALKRKILDVYELDVTIDKAVTSFIKRFGKFDMAIMRDVIEHVGNLTLFLNNVNRLLYDKGIVLITTPNAISFEHIMSGRDDSSRGAVWKDHVCYFEYRTLTNLLWYSGFRVEEVMHTPPNVDIAKKLNLKLQPWFGKDLYIVGMKVKGV